MPGEKDGNVKQPVCITLFRWGGQWGPLKVNIPCGECALTRDVIRDTVEVELKGIPIELDERDWLSEWWKPLPKGGWPPAVLSPSFQTLISVGFLHFRGPQKPAQRVPGVRWTLGIYAPKL